MAVASAQVAVTASAQAVASGATDATDTVMGDEALLLNAGATDVYLGGPGVTTTTGYKLATGAAPLRVELASLDQLFVVAATTGTLHVLTTK